MKNILFTLLLISLRMALIAQSEIMTTTVNINLRELPGTDEKVLCVIPKNTNLTVDPSLQEYEYWTKVQYGDKIGYVYNQYLKSPTTDTQDYQFHKTPVIKYYTNSKGERVQSPTYYNSPPPGATALCRDGTYSFSRSRRGTCSHHGGVKKWL